MWSPEIVVVEVATRRQSRPLRFSFEVAKPETRKPSTKQRWQIDLPHFKLNVK
jgi:hypothetical protein